MASIKKRLEANIKGPFFVDSSCINCGSCWQINPESFTSTGNNAYVYSQPKSKRELNKALLAVIDCPVNAIGSANDIKYDQPTEDFPLLVTDHPEGKIYYNGWSSRKSFGASSWLIRKESGNVLIDSPRWNKPLAKKIEQLGGISQMLLTHKDDIADHSLWAKMFKCQRWIHEADSDLAKDCETKITGLGSIYMCPKLNLIPVPGHTQGSVIAVLGDKKQILFSGDHLWWNRSKETLVASKKFCWWDWNEQVKSVEKLLYLDVEWLLPGHGFAKKFRPGEWKVAVEDFLGYC